MSIGIRQDNFPGAGFMVAIDATSSRRAVCFQVVNYLKGIGVTVGLCEYSYCIITISWSIGKTTLCVPKTPHSYCLEKPWFYIYIISLFISNFPLSTV